MDDNKIWIGWQEEQYSRQITIQLEDRERWPDAFVSVIAIRPNETEPYLVAGVSTEGNILTWTPNGYDTQYDGIGSAVVLYTQDEEGTAILGKSKPYNVIIGNSINADSAEIPDPYQAWVTTITGIAAQAHQSALEAASSATDAETAQGLAENARDSAIDARDDAISAKDDAVTAKDQAVSAKDDAEDSATLSESWAVGGTNTRIGEDTNNSKYWAELSQQQAQVAGYILTDVDDSTGQLIITTTNQIASDINFSIDENTGELEVMFV